MEPRTTIPRTTGPRSSIKKQASWAAVWAIGLLLLSARAWAGPQNPDDGCLKDERCSGHYNKAVTAFEEGRFEAALPEFQAAYTQRQMPWLLINIGRTLHRLGRPKDALAQYERYKQAESKSDPETMERLEKYIAQSKALLESSPPPPDPKPDPPPTLVPNKLPDQNGQNGQNGQTTDTASKPIYKKWWFWTIIGGVVAAGVITGVAVGVSSGNSVAPDPIPDGVMVYRPNF